MRIIICTEDESTIAYSDVFVHHLTFKCMIDIIIVDMSLTDMRLISGRFVCIVADQYATDK